MTKICTCEVTRAGVGHLFVTHVNLFERKAVREMTGVLFNRIPYVHRTLWAVLAMPWTPRASKISTEAEISYSFDNPIWVQRK